MPIPSLYPSSGSARPWSVIRAALYGAGIGLFAAAFKTVGPLREFGAGAAALEQIAGAAVGFALLCAGAAALRNVLARRFVWTDTE